MVTRGWSGRRAESVAKAAYAGTVIEFVKGHGTENDFVLLPDVDGALDLTDALVQALCDRRAGIGGDGVLRVVRVEADAQARELASSLGDGAAWFMDYRNADGSIAEMCGNGIRVFARYLVDVGLAPAGDIEILTRGGPKPVRLGEAGDVTVDMGVPRVMPTARTVSLGDQSWAAVEVDLGNPHAVVLLQDPHDCMITGEGVWAGPLKQPGVEPAFPDGVNVELVARRGEPDARHLAMRVHERGVGETRSCGTGACAAMVAAAQADGVRPGEAVSYVVDVPGGRLVVGLRADGHVELTGPAVLVASGTWQG